jgi:hypothetical protein
MKTKRGSSLLFLFPAASFFVFSCEESKDASDAAGDGDEIVVECSPPLVLCGDQCVDIQRDNDNCGACGYLCPIVTACRGGICVRICEPPCIYPRECCDGECLNTSSDRWNCGECGRFCALMETCEDGVCVSTQEL